jgi:hypothetical protein
MYKDVVSKAATANAISQAKTPHSNSEIQYLDDMEDGANDVSLLIGSDDEQDAQPVQVPVSVEFFCQDVRSFPLYYPLFCL